MDVEHEVIKAVISYAHGPDDREIADLSDRLRSDGIDCEIDQYDSSPAEGWPRWMNAQMNDRIALVACSERYYKRFRLRDQPGTGRGSTFESGLLAQRVVESQGSNHDVIPFVLRASDIPYIPEFLRDVTRYELQKPSEYDELVRRLLNQPKRRRPPLGARRTFASQADEALETLSDAPARTVLLFAPEIGLNACGFREIEREGQALRLVLEPKESVETSFLARIRSARKNVAVAFDLEALWASIVNVKDTIRDQRLVEVTLRDETPRNLITSEASFNGISADAIAAMRARRILLDERLPNASNPSVLSAEVINNQMLDAFVAGSTGQSILKVTRSPLPSLALASTKLDAEFLTAARLMAVLYLRLSGTVEHTESLSMSVASSSSLQIDFVGIRERAYSNKEPTRIEIHGVCHLT